MLLESRINDRTTLVIDAESVGGIDKGALTTQSHPDKIVPRTIEIIRAVAEQLSTAAEASAVSSMDVNFAVRVDSNSTVSVARTPNDGAFRVTLRWTKG